MKLAAAMLAICVCISAVAEEKQLCINRVLRALALVHDDVQSMVPVADMAAARLASGGKLWGLGPSPIISELSGRAGGLMIFGGLGDAAPDKNDVVLFFAEKNGPTPDRVANSGAYVIRFCGESTLADVTSPVFSNRSSECDISQTLGNTIVSWVFTGELVAALTRLGKMPVVYETIGIYDGPMRNFQYQSKNQLFHDDIKVPPIAGGTVGFSYIDKLQETLKRIDVAAIHKVGEWAAESSHTGGKLYMYSMGHMFPDEIGNTAIGKLFVSEVLNAGFRTAPAPQHDYVPNDLVIHIGYQHPPSQLIAKARKAGARVAYVSVHRDRDSTNDAGVIWLDPMWPWVDGCVSIEGYEVPFLPASGAIDAAIAWHIYEVTQLQLTKWLMVPDNRTDS